MEPQLPLLRTRLQQVEEVAAVALSTFLSEETGRALLETHLPINRTELEGLMLTAGHQQLALCRTLKKEEVAAVAEATNLSQAPLAIVEETAILEVVVEVAAARLVLLCDLETVETAGLD